MAEVAPSDVTEVLQHLHGKLNSHFRRLHEQRQQLEPASPVFALEHDLGEAELDMLKSAVRSGISDYWSRPLRKHLVAVRRVRGGDGLRLRGRRVLDDILITRRRGGPPGRSTIRDWFVRFHDQYGGARPTGAWAGHFTIISWPITHAVLPVYLQRQLAKLLYEFRTGLTSESAR